ncbi:TRAP transporter substrate-binding protein [Methylocella sp. CPCC 101449]|jgi:TRAP-type C4-dicarboxylate transport system substrate-binding protein|uniref:TRAP transporter substrate-binding protein n=1 Tax=Methylocella sp. CPCC 101449 TaxID=2987531 RepID=UPI00289126A6|nr:TRAP transporter substrate-binding protein [Methylocella sp. CPCC 101449]MDT2023748.1 TRAP transporter substrate-binding protein [Methylocella sp. CPCC 101449]HEV2573713.1 TRAP transporter substrate-binding protein [Beijerinckiaceae bacterium]
MHITRRALSALIPACAGLIAMTALAQAQTVKLRFAIFSPDTEQTYLTVFKPFAEAVNKENAGVEIELFPNGALGRNPAQQAQMVLDGVADIAWVVASYTPGRFQENEVFELPGLFRDLKESTVVMNRLINSGQIKGYEQFFPIGVFGTAPYSIHTREPIRTLADLKGKKIRAAGAIESETIKALGAVPIGMTTVEIPEAISRRTIDGTTSHPSPLFDFGIARVTNAHYFIRLGVVPLAILLNRAKFDSLPKSAQDAIRKHSGDWTAQRFNDGITAYNDLLMKRLADDPKRTVVIPPQSELDQAQPIYNTVIDAWVAKQPRNKELLDLVRKETAAYRAGQ